jgi:hypothetical protein
MTSLGTFRTQKSVKAKIAEQVARYPGNQYEIRMDGGKFYIVLMNARSPEDALAAYRARR